MRMRQNYDRDTQLQAVKATGWKVLNYKKLPLVVAFKKNESGRVQVKAWRGDAGKPAFYYVFGSEERARIYVQEYEKDVAEIEARKAARKAERTEKRGALKASDHYSEGDVLYDMWGYEQTNIDWYQVVELKPKSIVIRRISRNYGESGFMSGRSQPRRNDFTGAPVLKPLDECGRVSSKHGCFSKWDGTAKYESHYA